MRTILESVLGPLAARKIVLEQGQMAKVGRSSAADLSISSDLVMAELHFALACTTEDCSLRDLNSETGIFVRGERVLEKVLNGGEPIIAGETTFVLHLGKETALAVPEPSANLLQLLRGQPEPLFALLDAARDPGVLQALTNSEEEYQSLYEGAKGKELADFGPFLVRLPPSSPLLERLARQGWGRSWGVYLTSSRPFKEVRKHFRRFLLVKSPEGKRVYFRFYDPRVLRLMLAVSNCRETATLSGPVSCFLMEGQHPGSLLKFRAGPQGIHLETVPVTLAGEQGV